MHVLILEILAEGTVAAYILSAKDIGGVRESLTLGKLRKEKYLYQLNTPVSCSVSINTLRSFLLKYSFP